MDRPVARIFLWGSGAGGATEAKVDQTIEMKTKKTQEGVRLIFREKTVSVRSGIVAIHRYCNGKVHDEED